MKKNTLGASLVVQWLRLHASTSSGMDSIPGGRVKSHMLCGISKKRKKRRSKWQPTPVFLPGKSHGQGSLVGYRGHKESDMTEQLHSLTSPRTEPGCRQFPNKKELCGSLPSSLLSTPLIPHHPPQWNTQAHLPPHDN